ncbi:MAG: nitroreductase family protein [Oscillospiraceae bacterium]|nr:nitroreductase family protein [Oscillospiraceae bacterium]
MNNAIKARRSIRKFDPGVPVTTDQLKQLLEAAMLAPSAHNARPWEFIAVTNREMLDKIPQIHPFAKMCQTATAAIIVVAAPQTEISEQFFPQDCAAAVQNILLEAVELGLGTCWCGVYPRERRMADIGKLFGIAPPKIPFAIIAVGLPDESPAQRGFYEESKVTFIG